MCSKETHWGGGGGGRCCSTGIRKLCIIKYNFDRSAFLPFMDEIITEVYKLMQVSDHMLPVRTFERQTGECKVLLFLFLFLCSFLTLGCVRVQ